MLITPTSPEIMANTCRVMRCKKGKGAMERRGGRGRRGKETRERSRENKDVSRREKGKKEEK